MADEHQRSAHRPSRRSAIVNAAIRVFARQGFADASIQTVAAEAGVAPTAVYYHFAGKDELFEAALRQVLTSMSDVVVAARADDEPGDPEILGHVITAVWRWLETNPEAGALVNHHLPGATTRARALQQEFESMHVRARLRLHLAAHPTAQPALGGGPPRQRDPRGPHVHRSRHARPSDARR